MLYRWIQHGASHAPVRVPMHTCRGQAHWGVDMNQRLALAPYSELHCCLRSMGSPPIFQPKPAKSPRAIRGILQSTIQGQGTRVWISSNLTQTHVWFPHTQNMGVATADDDEPKPQQVHACERQPPGCAGLCVPNQTLPGPII